MKFVTLALIGLSAIAAVAQNNTTQKPPQSPIPGIKVMPPGPIVNIADLNLQAGCPVAFTEVALKRDAHYMLVKQSEGSGNSLGFKYNNKSGKHIESMLIRVELTVKRSIYDLDATTITRYMTLTENSGQVLPLNLITYAVGLVSLEQVTYTDGDTWTPDNNKNCRFVNQSTTERIGSAK